jgi:hypothetical protein
VLVAAQRARLVFLAVDSWIISDPFYLLVRSPTDLEADTGATSEPFFAATRGNCGQTAFVSPRTVTRFDEPAGET